MPANRFRVATLVLIASLAACGGERAPDSAAASKADTARKIELAPAPAAQPQLNDAPPKKAETKRAPAAKPQEPAPVPVAAPTPPAPVTTPAPAPAPARAEPAPIPTGSISAGSSLVVHPATKICTNTHHVGDRFTANLTNEMRGTNGLVIPAGSAVTMRVIESGAASGKDSVRLAFDVLSVKVGDETYEVDGKVTQSTAMQRQRVQSTADQAKKVGIGAAIGAIAGQVLGKNTRSTVTGAVIGAAAGGAVAAGTATYDVCMPAEGSITISLDRSLNVKLAKSGL